MVPPALADSEDSDDEQEDQQEQEDTDEEVQVNLVREQDGGVTGWREEDEDEMALPALITMSDSEEDQDQDGSDDEERSGEDCDDGEWHHDDEDGRVAEEGGMLGRRSEVLVPETLWEVVEEIVEKMVAEEELPGLARAGWGRGRRGRAAAAHQPVPAVAGRQVARWQGGEDGGVAAEGAVPLASYSLPWPPLTDIRWRK